MIENLVSDDPYKAPEDDSGGVAGQSPLVGTFIALCGCGAFTMGVLLLFLIALVLMSPLLNDSTTWPVEVELLQPASGLLICSFCLFRAALQYRKDAHWLPWFAGGIAVIGVITIMDVYS